LKKYVLFLFMVVSISLLFACSSNNKPSDVVKKAYTYANEGKYSEVEKCFSEDSLNYIKNYAILTGGIKGICDANTNNRTIENIEILDESIEGEGATVKVKFTYEDNSEREYDAELIKEKGDWKLIIK